MNRVTASILFSLVLGSASSVAMAKISIRPIPSSNVGGLMVFVGDDINREDLAALRKARGDMDRKHGANWRIIAKLNSRGGSVRAALEIGRILRRVGAMAVVESDAICMSSCVYVLAGAANRSVNGQVGIHRPYEPDGNETSASAQKQRYAKLGADVKEYFAEMNIPPKLYDDMLYISPEDVRVLTGRELQTYGLNQNDPFFEEADAVKQAQRLGISRAALAERKAKANRECPWDGDKSKEALLKLLDCRSAIINGH